MAKRVDRYSRLIAWLKVLLPLTALALLSTLFLLSRSVDPTTTIPFADTEVRERLRTQQITGPVFAGTTDAGDQISVRPGLTSSERPEADDLTAQINLSEGGQINLTAKSGELDTEGEIVIFRGSVVIENSEGYIIRTQQLRSSLSRIEADTLSSVSATSPLGDLQAGKMQLRSDPDSQSVQMVFTNGVKLIYRPKQTDR